MTVAWTEAPRTLGTMPAACSSPRNSWICDFPAPSTPHSQHPRAVCVCVRRGIWDRVTCVCVCVCVCLGSGRSPASMRSTSRMLTAISAHTARKLRPRTCSVRSHVRRDA
eukprot:1937154-Rhodomonas_salina.1